MSPGRTLLWVAAGCLALAGLSWWAWDGWLSEKYHFVHPDLLFLLAVLPWVWWLSRRSLAGLGRWRNRVLLALRTAVVVLSCWRERNT